MTESVPRQQGLTIAPAAPPYLQCIQWVPRRFAGGASPVTIVDLVFEQRVFAQVAEHAAALPGSSVFGALVGHLFEDPTCERRWARVERTIRSPTTLPESADASRLGQTLRATEMEWSPEEGEVLLGWYRTHFEGGLYLSPEEARFHEGGFPEPWGVALVLAGTGDRRAGGVFQRTDPEGLSRSVYTPFYELIDPTSEFHDSTRRTFVGWANYQTETPVLRAGRGSVSAGLPERRPGPRTGAKPPADAPGPAEAAKPRETARPTEAAKPTEGVKPTPAAAEPPATAERPPAVEQRPPTAGTPPPTAGKRAPATGKRPPTAKHPPTVEKRPRIAGKRHVADVERLPTTATTAPPGPAKDAARPTAGRPSPTVPVEPPREPVGPIRAPGERDSTSVRARKPSDETHPTGSREPVNSEAEWEKRQIQRSLMAVGRSLGPSDLGVLGPPEAAGSGAANEPAGDGDEHGKEPPRQDPVRTPATSESTRSAVAGSPTAPAAGPVPTVIPIHRDLDPRTGFVGRARRRLRVPGGRILAAAAGLTLVATAGLVGTRSARHDDAVAESPIGALHEESSLAGITLSPDELRRDRDPRFTGREAGDGQRTPDTGTARYGEDGAASDPGNGGDAAGVATATDMEEAVPVTDGPNALAAIGAAEPAQTRAEIVRAPALGGVRVEHPVVGGFDNALAIFRGEAERYETVRLAFDDGDETCNPLNLSYRGVREAFQRLERRVTRAGEGLPASRLRSFDSAARQFAMTHTHYTLTDCPMPVGG